MTDPTWVLRLDADGDGPRLAVKDCIDVRGTPTTVGCPAIADDAVPAEVDAPVVESARRAGARVVGKTGLVELCRHADGVNPWYGTPRNPLDPERIPGGSSSGSAVAVARDEADVAYGTDTGGSVRVPAACCGVAGLKTTAGRIPTHGVFEFSRTLDTVGPLARDVAGLVLGMRLLEPGFTEDPGYDAPLTVARLRFPGVEPEIDAAVDAALDAA
ncbi:MAG: amidase, partial [Streptosporangiales bacterium]|nr:amidase [Streptosporangiales bacterium]